VVELEKKKNKAIMIYFILKDVLSFGIWESNSWTSQPRYLGSLIYSACISEVNQMFKAWIVFWTTNHNAWYFQMSCLKC
jgi:hypothetical protein